MKTADIVQHLVGSIAAQTTRFGEFLDISSVTFDADTRECTIGLASPHGLYAGDLVAVFGLATVVSVEAYVVVQEAVSICTVGDHDQVNAFARRCYLRRGGKVFSGTISSVVDRRNLTLALDDLAGFIAASGDVSLVEPRVDCGNGVQEVVSIPDDNSFVIKVKNTVAPAICHVSGAVAVRNRVAGISEARSALDVLTPGSYEAGYEWLFVLLGGMRADKDPTIKFDAVYQHSAGVAYRQNVGQTFSVFAAVPADAKTVSLRPARDKAEEIRVLLIKALCGARFCSEFSTESKHSVVYVSDDVVDTANDQYLVYEFKFTTQFYIDTKDVFTDDRSVAFNSIAITKEKPIAVSLPRKKEST